MDRQVPKVPSDSWEPPVQWGRRDLREWRVPLDLLEQLVHRDLRVRLVQRERRDHRDRAVRRDRRVRKE